MENDFFALLIVSGLVFCVTGFLLRRFPPKKINSLYGYRTARSKATQQQWNFAQTHAAKEMMKTGGMLVLISVVGLIVRPAGTLASYTSLAIVVSLLVLMSVRVEKAIENKFHT